MSDAPNVPLKVLNRVVDSLHVRISADRAPSSWLVERFPGWRNYFESYEIGDDPCVVELPGLGSFRLVPSRRPYEFALSNPMIGHISIWNPEKWHSAVGGQTGQLYVDFRSRFLQLMGMGAVNMFLEELQALLFDPRIGLGDGRPAFVRVARMDLAVDLQMAPLTLADLSREDGGFIRRSKQGRVNNTLSDLSTGGIVSALLERKKHLYPPNGNKGVQTYKTSAASDDETTQWGGPWAWPELGVAARAARSAARAVAAAVREEEHTATGRQRAAFGHSLVFGRQHLQTINFGKFGSPLHARIYDKVAEVAVSEKFWLYDIWESAGWSRPTEDHPDESQPVWRTEFSVSGDFLKHLSVPTDHGITRLDARSLDDALAYIPVIWRYVTHNWLRHVHHTEDSNPWRWPSSAWWSLVEGAWLSPVVLKRVHHSARRQGLRLRPQEEKDAKAKQLLDQVQGVMVSLRALTDEESDPLADEATGEIIERPAVPSAAALQLLDGIREWLTSDEAESEIAMRRVLMGLDSVSDTAISALFRAQRMAEGGGS